MELIASPTEQTTAATDLILALLALAAILLLRAGETHRRRRTIWMTLFGLLTAAGVLGAAAHGIQLSHSLHELIWYPLNLILILLVSLFAVAAMYDLLGERGARRGTPPMIAVGLAVYASLYIGEGSFLWVIIYQAVVMLLSLAAYFTLAWRGTLKGAWWMVAGLVITILAAGVQASSIAFTLIWPFDHNGVFHLVQMVGVAVLVSGLKRGMDTP